MSVCLSVCLSFRRPYVVMRLTPHGRFLRVCLEAAHLGQVWCGRLWS